MWDKCKMLPFLTSLMPGILMFARALGLHFHRVWGDLQSSPPSHLCSLPTPTPHQDVATMQFCANKLDKKDFFGKSDPFLVFYRSNEDGT